MNAPRRAKADLERVRRDRVLLIPTVGELEAMGREAFLEGAGQAFARAFFGPAGETGWMQAQLEAAR